MKELPIQRERFKAMAEGYSPICMDPNMHHTFIAHGDLATQIITSMVTDTQKELHVNVPNEGSITNLPQGAIIEIPALIDVRGIRPLYMGKIPKGLVGLTSAIIVWEELTVDAALAGDRNLVVQALMAHPQWPITLDKAERLCDEMLKAHSKYLPQFSRSDK